MSKVLPHSNAKLLRITTSVGHGRSYDDYDVPIGEAANVTEKWAGRADAYVRVKLVASAGDMANRVQETRVRIPTVIDEVQEGQQIEVEWKGKLHTWKIREVEPNDDRQDPYPHFFLIIESV